MATIKSYTDLQQSKKLAEFLPLESADMYYAMTYTDAECNRHYNTPARIKQEYAATYETDIPCWSLAALLDALPYCPNLSKHTDGKWYITTYPNDIHTCLKAFNNPIDACVDMIERLHELNLL